MRKVFNQDFFVIFSGVTSLEVTAIAGSSPPEGCGVSMDDFELLKVLGTGGETDF